MLVQKCILTPERVLSRTVPVEGVSNSVPGNAQRLGAHVAKRDPRVNARIRCRKNVDVQVSRSHADILITLDAANLDVSGEKPLPPLRLCDNAGMNPPTDPAIEEARRAGFDLNLIETNLSLSPAERWRQHDMALEVILELEEARMARDSKLQVTPPTTR